MMDKINVLQLTDTYWINVLISALIPVCIAVALHFLIFFILEKTLRIYKKTGSGKAIKHLKTASLVFFIAVALKISLPMANLEETGQYIDGFLEVFLILSLAWLLTRIVGMGKRLILRQYDFDSADNLEARRIYTQFKIIERIMNMIIFIVAVALVLMSFEGIRKIGISLLASAGIAGIIIGFAAQKLLTTILAGLQIALAQPIRLDDVVIVEKEWGWIEEITLTYIVIRIWDKRRLIVPTTYFIEKPFENWTRTSSDILGTVYIYADYTLPVNELRKELTRILDHDANWDGKVNVLQVTNATDRIMEIRALVSAGNSPAAWDLRVNVREKLLEFLQKQYPDTLPKTRVSLDRVP